MIANVSGRFDNVCHGRYATEYGGGYFHSLWRADASSICLDTPPLPCARFHPSVTIITARCHINDYSHRSFTTRSVWHLESESPLPSRSTWKTSSEHQVSTSRARTERARSTSQRTQLASIRRPSLTLASPVTSRTKPPKSMSTSLSTSSSKTATTVVRTTSWRHGRRRQQSSLMKPYWNTRWSSFDRVFSERAIHTTSASVDVKAQKALAGGKKTVALGIARSAGSTTTGEHGIAGGAIDALTASRFLLRDAEV